jgi:hypothetical protein
MLWPGRRRPQLGVIWSVINPGKLRHLGPLAGVRRLLRQLGLIGTPS